MGFFVILVFFLCRVVFLRFALLILVLCLFECFGFLLLFGVVFIVCFL